MFELIEKQDDLVIGVFGIGGCGCNTINSIYEEGRNEHVNFFLYKYRQGRTQSLSQ